MIGLKSASYYISMKAVLLLFRVVMLLQFQGDTGRDLTDSVLSCARGREEFHVGCKSLAVCADADWPVIQNDASCGLCDRSSGRVTVLR